MEPPHRAALECRVEIDGAIRWFRWEGPVIFDARGRRVELQSVGFDVTERRAAADALWASLEELRQSEEKLRLLAQRQVAVREEERKRVGFDLHDGVCQELIGIGIMVESIRERHAAQLGDGAAELTRVGRYLGEVVEHLRLLAGELRPMLLHDLGLEGSLRSLALGLASAQTSITAAFPTAIPRLEETAEVTVYRIAQEALTNALRHARARAVRVELGIADGRLRLVIADDGCGFDPSRRRTTALGLLSMEERALALGGRLGVTSAPGAGTTILLDCPLLVRARASGGVAQRGSARANGEAS
jgi:signal transduction histidine kinase